MIDPSFSQRSLIENSSAVATLTGSSAWQAYLMGKPTIVFGNIIFKYAPSVLAYPFDSSTLIEYISKLQSDPVRISLDDRIRFLSSLDKRTFEYVRPTLSHLSHLSTEQSNSNLVSQLKPFFDNSHYN